MKAEEAWLINQLLKQERIFKIPVYQRNYDWNIDQCEKLFNDIVNAKKANKSHFMGSIIYINEKQGKLNVDLVIDGQQRITSLFILFKALLDKAIEVDDKASIRTLNRYLYNEDFPDESLKLKLKPVKYDEEQFKYLMYGKYDKMDSNSNIKQNFDLYSKMIDYQYSSEGLTVEKIIDGMEYLQVIDVSLRLDAGDDPQIVFENINSAGLNLSIADLIRNYLLMNCSSAVQDKLYLEYWLEMEKTIGVNSLPTYFADYLLFKSREDFKIENTYLKFKEFFDKKNLEKKSILMDLKKYSIYYSYFLTGTSPYGEAINKSLKDYILLDQSTIYPFLFPVFDDLENKAISIEQASNVLEFFKNYFVRRLICGVPSNSLRGLFKNLYNRIYDTDEKKKYYYEALYYFFDNLNTKDSVPSDIDFKNTLFTVNLYQKKNLCKYVLSSLENKGKENVDIKNLTIEHVMPKSEKDWWKKEVGDDYEMVHDQYLHTIGNLTLTGYNSELGTKKFEEKKNLLKDSKMSYLNKDILKAKRWNVNAITSRAAVLCDDAVQVFTSYRPEIKIQVMPNSMKKTFDDFETLTYTKPTAFSFCGENFNVDSYADMTHKVFELLALMDLNKLSELAKQKYKATSSDRIYISYEQSNLKTAKEIKNTGIYVEVSLSAKGHINFLQNVLEIFGFDEDDFYFIIE